MKSRIAAFGAALTLWVAAAGAVETAGVVQYVTIQSNGNLQVRLIDDPNEYVLSYSNGYVPQVLALVETAKSMGAALVINWSPVSAGVRGIQDVKAE